ncbi:unnamed protein product [Aspergillus oryzae]|nr:unnamed protein product [Aspergillus oryzae]
MALSSKRQPLVMNWMDHVQMIIETVDRFVRDLPSEGANSDGLTVGFYYSFVVSRSFDAFPSVHKAPSRSPLIPEAPEIARNCSRISCGFPRKVVSEHSRLDVSTSLW